jgi:predicted metal-binding protein
MGEPACEPRPGSLLVADTRRAAEGREVAVRQVACLGNCPRGISAAIFRTGCWAYVFGGLGTASGADLVTGAELFATSTDGFMPWRARPEALKRGLIARIPHPDILKELP